MSDVLIVGELLAEIMAQNIGQRFDTPGIFMGPYPSGAPGIFIDQVAKMGVSCSMIGCVGKDGFGDLILNRLKGDGVDISRIKRAENLPTGTAFVTYRTDGSREFIFNIGNSAAGLIDEAMVDEAWVEGCKYLHVMGSFMGTSATRNITQKGMKLAQAAGAKVTFDPNVRPELLASPGTKEAIMAAVAQCSVFLPSEIDLTYMFGEQEEASCIKGLLAKYPMEMIIVKKANKGATFYDRERVINSPAFLVTEVDPTGAGDCFGGAFVGCLAKKIDIQRALDLSCAAGALAVAKKGPMEGNATIDELEAFAKQAVRN